MGCNSSKNKGEADGGPELRSSMLMPSQILRRTGSAWSGTRDAPGIEIYSTSTEQRLREKEFYGRVLQRTNANFINVATAPYTLEGEDPYEFARNYADCVAGAELDQAAVKLFDFPKPALASDADAADVLARAVISDEEEQQVRDWTKRLVEAAQRMRIDDGGEPLVVG